LKINFQNSHICHFFPDFLTVNVLLLFFDWELLDCWLYKLRTDGTVFDSSVQRGQTISFPLGGVIKGWQEGLAMMKEGGKCTLVIPSDIAYGDAGSGDVIPPGATLKFEVELFKVSA
jgi:hypothetical protein